MLIDTEAVSRNLPALTREWQTSKTEIGSSVVVMDAFLQPSTQQDVIASFPGRPWTGWDDVADALQAAKRSSERIDRFPPLLATLIYELNSGPMIRLLEEITGIRGLLPDPHLWGGGLHVTSPGGYLWPHTDFPHDHELGLMRMLNLLIYTHPHWTPPLGGHFQLWRAGAIVRSIVPLPGRCVLFRTDAESVHGVSRVEGTLDRQSVALFYYTLPNPPPHPPDTTTGWQLRSTPAGSTIPPLRQRFAAAVMRASVALKSASVALNMRAERIMNAGRPPQP